MADEDLLPKELDKLEITPILPQIKLLDWNLPMRLNPFFETELKDNGAMNKNNQTTDPPTKSNRTRIQICQRCRLHRVSKKLKMSTSSSSGLEKRKVLIREPVLKVLQTSRHPHGILRKKTLKTGSSDSAATNKKFMSVYQDLVDTCCNNILSLDVHFSRRLNQLRLTNRDSKNFTTIQTFKRANNKRSLLTTTRLALSSTETSTLVEDTHGVHSVSSLHTLPLECNTTSTNLQQRNTNNISPDQLSNLSRCNTSCSQQAGNSAPVACDDVTIDELASYFDTLVHIPKKMSTMAEMMYI